VVSSSADEAARVLSQLKIVIRTNYSNPPTFGASVVALVLTTPALRALWEDELAGMRLRIRAMRARAEQALGEPENFFERLLRTVDACTAEQLTRLIVHATQRRTRL
jgi:aspartate/tyrosine/aromatic aminotransferase